MKRFELRRNKQRRRDDPSRMSSDVKALGGVDRHRIPAVAESQYARVCWHHVDDDTAFPPAAERSSLGSVLNES